MKLKKVKLKLKFKLNRKKLRLILIVLAVLGLLFYFKNQLIVAWVNGRPIFRCSYNREINKLAGKQTLDALTVKSLIKQEAKKQTIGINQEEIDKELKNLEEFAQSQELKLEQLLEIQGLTKQDLIEDIKLQKLVEKMAGTESAAIQEWLMKLQSQAKIVSWF